MVATKLNDFISEHENHLEDALDHVVRKIKGVGANLSQIDLDGLNCE
jgi:hypothetical protein